MDGVGIAAEIKRKLIYAPIQTPLFTLHGPSLVSIDVGVMMKPAIAAVQGNSGSNRYAQHCDESGNVLGEER